jgi:DNA-binding transcriptional LysR family regulator
MQGPTERGRSFSWDDVRVFVALCRSRTVGAAAASLGVDASTVSRRLTAMEGALSAVLFERGRDGLTATKAAEDLMPVAEEIEQMMARFANEAEGLERLVAGTVRIACTPDIAEVLVAPLVPGLRTRHPSLRLVIDPGEHLVDLTRREADLALRTVKPTRGDLIVTRLAAVRWVPVAAPRLADVLGRLRSWKDAPWIGWGERLSGIAPARWLAAHVGEAAVVVRSDSLMLQLALIRDGVGAALVPEPSQRHFGLSILKTKRTLQDSADPLPFDELFLVTHRALHRVPRVRAVWDLLVERVAALTAPGARSPSADV